jgi:hypothetical protein
MTFGPALSLGVLSLAEYLDVKLLDAPEPEELVRRLQEVESQGLHFERAVRLRDGDRNVGALVDAARYVVAFADKSLAPLGGRAGLAERLAAFLAESEHKLRRDVQGIGKIVDVRALTLEARLGADEELGLLERAGLLGALVPLVVTLRVAPSGSAKIAEVVEALTGERAFPHQPVRTALLVGEHTPLDVEALREGRLAEASIAQAAG